MAKRIADRGFTDFGEHVHERMDRVWRAFGGPPGTKFGSGYMEPPVDVYQTETEVIVLMDIAGILREEIELRAEGRKLLIRGERKPLSGPRKRQYSQMEIAHGAFQRLIDLPAVVNPGAAQCSYEDGILKIELPRAEPAGETYLRIIIR